MQSSLDLVSENGRMTTGQKGEEEQQLEALLFGYKYEKNFQEVVDPSKTDELFYVDTSRREDISEEALKALRDPSIASSDQEDKPAWEDEEENEEDKIQIYSSGQSKRTNIYSRFDAEPEQLLSKRDFAKKLKEDFSRIHCLPEWAKGKSQEGSDEISSLNPFKVLPNKSQGAAILPDILSISRLNNANITQQTKGPIASVRFHPNGNVLLTGGKDNKINLIQIANNKSEIIKTVEFEGLPIGQAEFILQGREIICVGRQKIFYTFDLERMKIEQHFGVRGTETKSFYKIFPSPHSTYIAVISYAVNGECILISGKTKQYLTCFKVNSSLYAVAFSPCENFLYLTGGDRSIFVFDIRTQSCIASFPDNGGLKGTALGVSPDGTRLACGSDSGIVNLYEFSNGDASQLELIKSLENLTTWIESIRFNSTSELMGVSGNQKDNHFRILHLGTNRVYSNWPAQSSSSLGRIQTFDWSNHNGYMSMGNHRGEAMLFKLSHYN